MEANYLSPIFFSIEVTLIAGSIAILFGILCGYLMNKYTFRGKFLLEILFLLPIILPASVIGFLLLIALGNNSILFPIINVIFGGPVLFTKFAAIIASTVVAFPLMYQAAKISFSQVDKDIINAARLDGISEFHLFFKIILPLCKQSLLGGAILSFARAFGEFGATIMIAGNIPNKTQTMPTAIYMAISSNDRTTAWIYVIIMIFISIAFLLLIRKNNEI